MTVSVSHGSPAERYWLAIPEDERAAIEAAVPAGCWLVISTGLPSQPGTATVSLRDERNYRVGPAVRGYLTARLCWAALPRVVVTTDAAGYVESIEEVA